MSQEQPSEIVMLSRMLLLAVASVGLLAGSNSADAASSSRQKPQLTTSKAATIHVRPHRSGPPSFSARASSAGGRCGTWICTWPTSGGGCLVWEKTLCKIKTIDPFN
jgi:hypothetical protein